MIDLKPYETDKAAADIAFLKEHGLYVDMYSVGRGDVYYGMYTEERFTLRDTYCAEAGAFLKKHYPDVAKAGYLGFYIDDWHYNTDVFKVYLKAQKLRSDLDGECNKL